MRVTFHSIPTTKEANSAKSRISPVSHEPGKSRGFLTMGAAAAGVFLTGCPRVDRHKPRKKLRDHITMHCVY